MLGGKGDSASRFWGYNKKTGRVQNPRSPCRNEGTRGPSEPGPPEKKVRNAPKGHGSLDRDPKKNFGGGGSSRGQRGHWAYEACQATKKEKAKMINKEPT